MAETDSVQDLHMYTSKVDDTWQRQILFRRTYTSTYTSKVDDTWQRQIL